MSRTRLAKLRMARVLMERREREGSYSRLEKSIQRAWSRASGADASKPRVVDRRKLQRIVAGEPNVVLSMLELNALDAYLLQYNEGLAQKPIFARSTLMEALSEAGDIAYLVGSKPGEDYRIDLSHFDALAMASLQRSVYRHNQSAQFDVVQVMLQPPQSRAEKTWLDAGKEHPAVICVGSSRACMASEFALAEMFSIAPFQQGPAAALPFSFLWRVDDSTGSSFSVDVARVRQLNEGAAERVEAGDAWALVVGERVELADHPRERQTVKDYGVIAAQRQRNGVVSIVLSGLSGPGTHACARVLASVTDDLPRAPSLMWLVVEAEAKVTSDGRQLLRQRIIKGPQTWDPSMG